MNKTKYIILSIALCFSLVLVAYSLRVSADVNMTQEISPSYPSEPSEPAGDGNGGDSTITGGGLAVSNDISNLNDADMGSEPDPGEVEIGDTFTGPSGTTYVLQTENLTPEEQEYYNSNGLSTDGVWVEVSTTGSPTDDGDKYYYCKVCSGANCVSQKFSSSCSSLCSTNADCQIPSTITPTVDPSQAQYRCMQCRCH